MKNLFALFPLVTLLFLTSCAKEEIIQPDVTPETVTQIEAKTSKAGITLGDQADAKGNSILVAVTTDTYSIVGNELIAEFSSNHDFSTSIVEATQQLEFVDIAGNTSTLTFQMNSHTCLLYTSPSPRDPTLSRMPSSA